MGCHHQVVNIRTLSSGLLIRSAHRSVPLLPLPPPPRTLFVLQTNGTLSVTHFFMGDFNLSSCFAVKKAYLKCSKNAACNCPFKRGVFFGGEREFLGRPMVQCSPTKCLPPFKPSSLSLPLPLCERTVDKKRGLQLGGVFLSH